MSSNMQRRAFLKISGLGAAAGLVLGIDTGVAAEARPLRRPNIVLIFADDLGWRDVGYQGSDFMEKIKDLGLEENTLVVFTSDNGGTGRSSQEPLRGSKGCYYEGGIREPFIVRWPGVTRPGSQCDVPVINVDLFPTFLAAAGIPVPEDKELDGESLLPLLKGDSALQRQAIFWHFPGYLDGPVPRGREQDRRTGFRTRPVSVIHKGEWKLHLFHEEWQLDGGREKLATNNAVELYNLTEDIGERNNLAGTNPAKRDELLDDLFVWLKATDALVPTKPNPAYNPSAVAKMGDEARGKKLSKEVDE